MTSLAVADAGAAACSLVCFALRIDPRLDRRRSLAVSATDVTLGVNINWLVGAIHSDLATEPPRGKQGRGAQLHHFVFRHVLSAVYETPST